MQYRDNDTMSRDRSSTRDRGSWSGSNERAFFGDHDRDRNDRYESRDRNDRGYQRGYDRSYNDYQSRGRNQRFGRSGSDRDDLIASDRVEGTAVYGRDGNELGSIHNFMVEKRGGRVAYAVMKRSSGFLDMDERYYPLNWSELDYDTDRAGYCVDLTEDDLKGRRSFDSRGRPVNDRNDDRGSSSW